MAASAPRLVGAGNRRWMRLAALITLAVILLLVLVALITRLVPQGRPLVLRWGEAGPWVSFPPLRGGSSQTVNYLEPSPPEHLSANSWERRYWGQLHAESLLESKSKYCELTEEEINRLIELVSFPDLWYVRSHAIYVVAWVKCSDANTKHRIATALLDRLNDRDWHVRVAAACGLLNIDARNHFPSVLSALRSSKNQMERNDIITAVFRAVESDGAVFPKLAHVEIRQALTDALRDEDADVRRRAEFLLTMLEHN